MYSNLHGRKCLAQFTQHALQSNRHQMALSAMWLEGRLPSGILLRGPTALHACEIFKGRKQQSGAKLQGSGGEVCQHGLYNGAFGKAHEVYNELRICNKRHSSR
jgi:hypothetical protein